MNGGAVNDTNCSMSFSLWDSQNLPFGKVGTDQAINGITASNGLFTVVLNGAGEIGDSSVFNDHHMPLAIYGYFPAKVTLEEGAIKRGDPLTSSSKPAYGMKATQACKIIGYALEDAEQEGAIQVFANHGENAAGEVASLRAQVKELKDQNALFESRLANLEQTKPMSALGSNWLDARTLVCGLLLAVLAGYQTRRSR